MIGHRDLKLEEYVEILRRRLWVIVVPAVLFCAAAYGYSLTVPNRYMSQTLVLVQQQKVPDRFVTPVVTDAINQRLSTMREQILSRTRLEPIIERYNLFKDAVGKAPTEDLVDRLRKAIAITPVQPIGGGKEGLSGFFISFTWSDPRTAQQVCEQITSMFMEENLKVRTNRAEQTTLFLERQLKDAKAKLDEQDARLAEFKRRHIGQLPGQEQMNLNILMGLNTQLEATTQFLNRTQQDKTYAESVLSSQIAEWQASQQGTSPQTLEQQLQRLQNQLLTLEGRYTADHPDVIKLKNDIAQLQRKIDAMRTAPPGSSELDAEKASLTEPTSIQQLRNQIRIFDQSIKEKTRGQERLQEQIRVYQARVQLSPAVEQQYKELTRDYDTAQANYNDLLGKRTQSEIATDLERDQQGEQFSVMDPANLPEKPSYPNRGIFALGGLAGGFAFGAGLGFLLELRDKSIRNERDVEALLGLPTLALLPALEPGANARGSLGRKGRSSPESLQGHLSG